MSILENAKRVFGPTGYLSQHVKDYQSRSGQEDLAIAVWQTLHESSILIAEAPCGSGKGFAYAVPLVHQPPKCSCPQAVIVTANIALQNQLIMKDLPLLQEALPEDFTIALLKGRNNFLCMRKAHQLDLAQMSGDLNEHYGQSPEVGEQLSALLAIAAMGMGGDRDGYPNVPNEVWRFVSSSADECVGGGCPFYSDCWANKHRASALRADVIVTNYHLLFAHTKVLSATDGKYRILPKFRYLVMDEAHEAAKIARDAYETMVSYTRFSRFATALERDVEVSGEALRRAARAFFQQVAAYGQSRTYRRRGYLRDPVFDVRAVLGALAGITQTLTNRLSKVEAEVQVLEGKLQTSILSAQEKREIRELLKRALETRAAIRQLMKRAAALDASVDEVTRKPLTSKVYWIEIVPDRPVVIKGQFIEVGELFERHVYPLADATIITSATLTAVRSFDSTRRELGIPKSATELIVESPFDFRRDARLIVAGELDGKVINAPTNQNRSLYNESLVPLYKRVIDIWSGRLLCLLTANADMDWLYKQLDGYAGREFLKQHTDKIPTFPRHELTAWFRESKDAVLLGVDSFWTGIDIPGPKGIIIHRLPFDAPTVVTKALQRKVGDNQWYSNWYYPRMIRRLRQGNGRLLRREDDYGFVVCCDRRITDKAAYAGLITRSLPYDVYWRTEELDFLDEFLQARAIYEAA